MEGKRKEIKCVVWDLDNTIWDGVLLESNKVQLKPKIYDIIKTLDARGILNSISSKNDYTEALKKIEEFGLKEYFLYPEIHWNAKSVSIGNIQKNLNIGMDTIMFVDDQPFELEEVKSVHPDVYYLDAAEYLNMLENPVLNPKFITVDSSRRRLMYLEDMERKVVEETYTGPKESFLASLNMKFIIKEAQEEDLKREEELTIRTNQLNATGKTYDYDELNAFRLSKNHKLFICELTDNFGSYGKIGVALVEIMDDCWFLRLMLMSCRVISRGVGTVMLTYIMQETKKEGKVLRADFKDTGKNRMMNVSFRFSNFKEIFADGNGSFIFENDLAQNQEFPNYIDVKIL